MGVDQGCGPGKNQNGLFLSYLWGYHAGGLTEKIPLIRSNFVLFV